MMRKRNAARPQLESMEARVVPGAVAIHMQVAQEVAAHIAKLQLRRAEIKTARAASVEAHLQHRHGARPSVQTRVVQPGVHHQAQPQKHTNAIATFFKSLFGGL
jgi:hypothetical protein